MLKPRLLEVPRKLKGLRVTERTEQQGQTEKHKEFPLRIYLCLQD